MPNAAFSHCIEVAAVRLPDGRWINMAAAYLLAARTVPRPLHPQERHGIHPVTTDHPPLFSAVLTVQIENHPGQASTWAVENAQMLREGAAADVIALPCGHDDLLLMTETEVIGAMHGPKLFYTHAALIAVGTGLESRCLWLRGLQGAGELAEVFAQVWKALDLAPDRAFAEDHCASLRAGEDLSIEIADLRLPLTLNVFSTRTMTPFPF